MRSNIKLNEERSMRSNIEIQLGAVIQRLPKFLGLAALIIFITSLLWSSWFQVPAGSVGIITRLGAVQDAVFYEGAHFKFPLVDTDHILSIQPVRVDSRSLDAVTKPPELQSAFTDVSAMVQVDPIYMAWVYRNFGSTEALINKVTVPAMEESLKAATATFSASDLVGSREAVRNSFIKGFDTKLSKWHLDATQVSVTQFKFSDGFTKAIEAKVTANERANKAENELREAQAEANKRVAEAEGEAKAIRAQSEAIQKAGGDDYIKLKWIEKWDGKLPVTSMGSSVPMMVNIGK